MVSELARTQRKLTLSQNLGHRPSAEVLRERGILDDGEFDDVEAPVQLTPEEEARARYFVGLQAAAKLFQLGRLNKEERVRVHVFQTMWRPCVAGFDSLT